MTGDRSQGIPEVIRPVQGSDNLLKKLCSLQDGLYTVLLRLCDASYDLPKTLSQGIGMLMLLPTAPDVTQVCHPLPG